MILKLLSLQSSPPRLLSYPRQQEGPYCRIACFDLKTITETRKGLLPIPIVVEEQYIVATSDKDHYKKGTVLRTPEEVQTYCRNL